MPELLKSDDASSPIFSQGVSGNAVILFIFTLPLYIPADKFFDDNIMCLKNQRKIVFNNSPLVFIQTPLGKRGGNFVRALLYRAMHCNCSAQEKRKEGKRWILFEQRTVVTVSRICFGCFSNGNPFVLVLVVFQNCQQNNYGCKRKKQHK